MTLQIGTILIAKESFGDYTKDKEYSILKNDRDVNYKVSSDKSEVINWLSNKVIEYNFTIKRYTLTDLQEKKIAVKLRNYAEYKILCEAVGDKNSGVDTYGATDDYFGNDNFNGNSIVFLTRKELEGRILVPSIDLIDLEVKEEVKVVESHHVKQLESEIARLKGENEELKKKINLVELTEESTCNKYSSALTEIAQLKRTIKQLEGTFIQDLRESTPDLEKRERMAWELFMKYEHMEIDRAFELTDTFLAKSKEVGNG